jgi:hypothetical protein
MEGTRIVCILAIIVSRYSSYHAQPSDILPEISLVEVVFKHKKQSLISADPINTATEERFEYSSKVAVYGRATFGLC